MKRKSRALAAAVSGLLFLIAAALPAAAADTADVVFIDNKTRVESESQLRKALAEAGKWEVVEVGVPLKLHAPIVVPDGREITLTGELLSWDGEEGGSMLVVESGGKLVLKAAALDARNLAGIAYVHAGGKLTVEERSVLKRGFNEQAGGGVYNNGSFTMKGGSICECKAGQGGGVFNAGEFLFEAGTISDNSAETGKGGGVFNEGSLILRNGKLADNTAAEAGSGLYHAGTAPLFEAHEHPAIEDGFYLAGNTSIKLNAAGLDTGASLCMEGMDGAKAGRVVVSGADDDDLKGFQRTPGLPWWLERSGSNLVLRPEAR